ncbi:hypothetical protein BKA70DRAFT_1274790 [Coprinopsis sp. MPI-PUGE-AT-0042]|nr:hypothetical protein BKA70DRAFT_1274790 [Coprinopsis sp. MPI-PUGE-AT-0042]
MGRIQPSPASFPIELLYEVAESLPRKDVLQLATASRQFHAVATRLLYRKLFLYRDSTIKACISTLAFNPYVAGHVRSLDVYISRRLRVELTRDPKLKRAFSAAFKNVAPSLTRLSLECENFSLAALVKRLPFPLLVEFHTSEALQGDVARFLRLHPHLQTVVIKGHGAAPQAARASRGLKGASQETGMDIPSVRTIASPCSVIPLFLPSTRPEKLRIVCRCGSNAHANTEDALLSALGSSDAPLQRLTFYGVPSNSKALFDIIKSNFTQLSVLGLDGPGKRSWASGGATLDGLLRVVPYLPNLQRLEAYSIYDSTYERLEEDYVWISRLSQLQDSLCVVSTSTYWARLKNHGTWLPLDEGDGVLRWWLHHSNMLLPLQCAAFPAGACFIADKKAGRGCRKDRGSRYQGRQLGHLASNPSPSTDNDDDDQQERFQLCVRSADGNELKPYIDTDPRFQVEGESPPMAWECFLLCVGVSCLMHLRSVDALSEVLQAAREAGENPMVPVLEEADQELFLFVLDVIWASIHHGTLPVERYLINPEQTPWKHFSIGLPFREMLDELATSTTDAAAVAAAEMDEDDF